MKNLKMLVIFLSLVFVSQSFASSWTEMDQDGREMTQLILAVADQVAQIDNHDDLHVRSVQKSRTLNSEIYKISGMIIVGSDMVLGEFVMTITKTAHHHRFGVTYTYEVSYQRSGPDFPASPPLVRQ